jgi:hypothetical protein
MIGIWTRVRLGFMHFVAAHAPQRTRELKMRTLHMDTQRLHD